MYIYIYIVSNIYTHIYTYNKLVRNILYIYIELYIFFISMTNIRLRVVILHVYIYIYIHIIYIYIVISTHFWRHNEPAGTFKQSGRQSPGCIPRMKSSFLGISSPARIDTSSDLLLILIVSKIRSSFCLFSVLASGEINCCLRFLFTKRVRLLPLVLNSVYSDSCLGGKILAVWALLLLQCFCILSSHFFICECQIETERVIGICSQSGNGIKDGIPGDVLDSVSMHHVSVSSPLSLTVDATFWDDTFVFMTVSISSLCCCTVSSFNLIRWRSSPRLCLKCFAANSSSPLKIHLAMFSIETRPRFSQAAWINFPCWYVASVFMAQMSA